MTDPRDEAKETTVHLRLIIEGTEYTYQAQSHTRRGKEIRRVAKLIKNTKDRLDRALDRIRMEETGETGGP